MGHDWGKGYASKATREAARIHRASPVIRHKSNEKHQLFSFAATLYIGSARIEQDIEKLKRFNRIALAVSFILVKPLHAASYANSLQLTHQSSKVA